MIRTLDEHVRSGVCRLTPLSHDVVESEIELVEGAVGQLNLVSDSGARKRVHTSLSDFRRMYLATFVADSRVSVFELYDCMLAVSKAFMQLQFDCDWSPDTTPTIAHARNLAMKRLQACMDEAVLRTGMVDPRPFAADATQHEQYMELIRSWPSRRDDET